MSDYNNGTLPDPCLRLDYGFGEQWASVELGDGTGYVRLADYESVQAENAKLRELLCELYEDQCDDGDRWKYRDRMSKFGIEEE
jgi:hypothetical protein